MTATDGDFMQRGWPYVALAVLACGLALRAWLTAGRVPAVRRAVAEGRSPYPRGWLWHVGWATLATAHAIGLLFPRAVLAWNRAGWRLYALEAITAAAGAIVVALWLRALGRHLAGRDAGDGAGRQRAGGMLSPSSLLLDLGDSVFLSLVALALVSGLLLAAIYRWGSSWGAVTLTPYLASIARGRPATLLIDHLPPLARLHVSVTFAAVAAFPFTRLAAVPVVALLRGAAACMRPVAAARRVAGSWMRRGPATWLWPEAQVRWAVRQPVAVRGRPAGAAGTWRSGVRPDNDVPRRPLETKTGP